MAGSDGRYELLEVVGHGASGVVHLARDRVERRYVAAKVLQQVAADELSQLRFLNEQRIGVEHPHVLATLDWVQSPERALLVMELADAGSLEDVLALNEQLSPSFVEHVAAQALEGLKALHDARIVHRDIKPGNVMLRRDGHGVTVKIGDLGVAVAEGRPRLTQDISVVGTLGYVAPEVLAGAPHDERSDLWALGKTIAALEQRSDPPVSRRLAQLIGALTRDDPPERPASAAEALVLLDAAADDTPLSLPVIPERVERAVREDVRRRRRTRAFKAVAGVAAVALIVGGIIVARPDSEPDWLRERRAASEQPGIRYLTFPNPTRRILRADIITDAPYRPRYSRGGVEIILDLAPDPSASIMAVPATEEGVREVESWTVVPVESREARVSEYLLARPGRLAKVEVANSGLEDVSAAERDAEAMRFISEVRWDSDLPSVGERYRRVGAEPDPAWAITHDGVDLMAFDSRRIDWDGLPGSSTTVMGNEAKVTRRDLTWRESPDTVVRLVFDRRGNGIVDVERWLREWRGVAEALRPSTADRYEDLRPDLPSDVAAIVIVDPAYRHMEIVSTVLRTDAAGTPTGSSSSSIGPVGSLGAGLPREDAEGALVWISETPGETFGDPPECAVFAPFAPEGAPPTMVELDPTCVGRAQPGPGS